MTVKLTPHVARAQANLEAAQQDRNQLVQKAKADGNVTASEQKKIDGATAFVGIRAKNVQVQRSVKKLVTVKKDAHQNGSVSNREAAAIKDARQRMNTLTAQRTELRRAYKADFGELPKQPQSSGATEFNLGSFNITGSSHTRAGAEHPEKASGTERMKMAVKSIQQHKLDVVGFQELQGDQLKQFMKSTKNQFGVYPGFKLGRRETVNSVAWDKSKFELVKGSTVKIPYFNGQLRRMPVVLLRNKQTGQKMFFTNFHNPADTARFHHQEKYRDRATQLEIALVKRLQKNTGLPVILTGDMNEKQEYGQHMRAGSNMHAAIDGKNSHTNKVGIDWMFGSPDVKFSDYRRDRSRLVRKTTDHPLITAHVTIPDSKKK